MFSVVLPESEIVDDILHMADETMKLYEQEKLTPTPIVAPLSHNRLLLNNRIINPDTPCTLYSNGSKVADCTFLSTVVKEKENVEKRKEPEVSATERGDASATRKRRYPIESLRNGEMELVCHDEQSSKHGVTNAHQDENSQEADDNSEDYE